MSTSDGGITDYKTEKEHNSDMEELGLRFQYGCFMDKLPQSCYSLGLWFDNYKEDISKAMEVFKMNCQKNKHAESCLKYANGLFYGRGLDKNVTEAFNVFKSNCEDNNHDRSCFAAGMFRANSISSHTVDYAEALTYFDKGCGLDFSASCFQAGLMKMQQEETDRDWPSIAKYWTKACNLGNYRGCVNLAVMHKKGDFFEENIDEYKRLMEKAEASLRNNAAHIHGEIVKPAGVAK